MSIFSSRIYFGKYSETDRHVVKKEDLDGYESAELKPSEFGMSVCLVLKSGGKEFIPVGKNSKPVTDVSLDKMVGATVITLSRDGDKDIKRIEF